MAAAKKAAKAAPTLTKVTVAYGAGVTSNIGNYESYKSQINLAEEYDVTGVDPADVEDFLDDRRDALKTEADKLVEAEYAQNSIYAKRGVKGSR